MKKRNNIVILILLFSLIFPTSCLFMNSLADTPSDHIKFRIAGVSFSKIENYGLQNYNPAVNYYEFILADPAANPFEGYTFGLYEAVKIDEITKEASLPQLDKSTYYNYKLNKKINIEKEENSIFIFNLYNFYQTNFIHKEGNDEFTVEKFASNENPAFNSNNYKNLTLRSGTTNDLSLNYNFYGQSAASIEVNFENKKEIEFVDLFGAKSFNYNAKWEEIIRGEPVNFDRMLNIVVIADGFTKTDIDFYYKQYVETMKNELYENKFFRSHWEKINIIRVDTISLEQNSNVSDVNYNIIGVNRNSQMGNVSRIFRVIQTSFLGSPITISNLEAEQGIRTSNIDAVVIIPKNYYSSYTVTYGQEIAKKNGQPVNISVVQPGGSLAHQLGHALAKLQDESPYACAYFDVTLDFGNLYYPTNYNSYYRNISSFIDGIKWQRFIYENYPHTDSVRPQYGLGTEDYPFTNNLYNDNSVYYIPTQYSTMGQRYYPLTNQNVTQFGPVNSYHLEASFLIRTEAITGNNNIKDQNYTGNNNYEWEGYRISTFKNNYPPSYFEDE